MTLGEIYYGRWAHSESVFYVNVGYGIGSAIVVHGIIYEGHSEIGHTIVRDSEERCNCGNFGCLTALASGHAIERMANGSLHTKNERWINAEEVAELAANGDEQANEIYRMAGTDLGRGIAIAANLLNPDRIIIGGGVAQAGEPLLSPLRSAFGKYAMREIQKNTVFEASELGMKAGILGAVALALNTAVFRTFSH